MASKTFNIVGEATYIDMILDDDSHEDIGNDAAAAEFVVRMTADNGDPDDEMWDLNVEVQDGDEELFLAWCKEWHVDCKVV
jgi:hypothetical protein